MLWRSCSSAAAALALGTAGLIAGLLDGHLGRGDRARALPADARLRGWASRSPPRGCCSSPTRSCCSPWSPPPRRSRRCSRCGRRRRRRRGTTGRVDRVAAAAAIGAGTGLLLIGDPTVALDGRRGARDRAAPGRRRRLLGLLPDARRRLRGRRARPRACASAPPRRAASRSPPLRALLVRARRAGRDRGRPLRRAAAAHLVARDARRRRRRAGRLRPARRRHPARRRARGARPRRRGAARPRRARSRRRPGSAGAATPRSPAPGSSPAGSSRPRCCSRSPISSSAARPARSRPRCGSPDAVPRGRRTRLLFSVAAAIVLLAAALAVARDARRARPGVPDAADPRLRRAGRAQGARAPGPAAADRREPGQRAGRGADGRLPRRRPRAAAHRRDGARLRPHDLRRARPRPGARPTSTATATGTGPTGSSSTRPRTTPRTSGTTAALADHARAGAERTVVLNPGVVPDRGYFDVADVVVTFEGAYRAVRAPPRTARPRGCASCRATAVAVLVYGAVARPGGGRRRGRGARRLRLRHPGRPPPSVGDGARLHHPGEPDDRGVHTMIADVTLELERFAWGAPDRLEVAGTFTGLEEPDAAPPILVLSGAGRTHRLPRGRRRRRAGGRAPVGGRLRLGGRPRGLRLRRPAPRRRPRRRPARAGRRGRGRGSSCPRGLPGPSRTRRSPASTGSSSRPTR